MKTEELFQDTITLKIWKQYMLRLATVLNPLDNELREETTLEIQAHLLESFQHEEGESEADRLLNVLKKMGEPEVYLKPMIADKLIVKGSRSMKPAIIFKGLYYSFSRGFKKVVQACLFGLGYLIVFWLGFMALLKPFFPKNVGLLLFEEGDASFGLILDSTGLKTDVFGYWIIPGGFVLAVLLYICLSKWLRFLKGSNGNELLGD